MMLNRSKLSVLASQVCNNKRIFPSYARVCAAGFAEEVKPPTPDQKSTTPKPASTIAAKLYSSVGKLIYKNRTGVLVGGSMVTIVGVTNMMYYLGLNFMNMSTSLSLYYGFTIGTVATASATIGAYILDKSFRVGPESAVYFALREIRNNKDLIATLGTVTAGDVRSYTISSTGVAILGGTPQFIHPKIQITFYLQGSKSNGVVSAVYTKKGLFTRECEYVSVDWVSPAGQTLTFTIKGDDSQFTASNIMKDHAKLLVAKSPRFKS
jgi:hypothetical protein